MNIATSDLQALYDKTVEFYEFIRPFEHAIHRDDLWTGAQPFDDYVQDIARISRGLKAELDARATAPIQANSGAS